MRYALRELRRNRAFALTAITVLAIGIGANTAVFSVVKPADTLVFAAVPVVVGLVALLASYVPARRATAIDPAVIIKYE